MLALRSGLILPVTWTDRPPHDTRPIHMSTFIESNVDLPLWAGLARRVDPPTAKAAGANAKRFKGGHARLILDALAQGHGTKDELAALIGTLNEQQVERRMHELIRDGLVVVVGEGVSPTGCRETVYGRA